MGFKLSELKLPGFNKKKEVTDSSTAFEEKNVLMQEKMNRIYKFGGISGMAVGVLSLLALNGALPLKSTVVEAYLINGVTGVAERLTSVKKENLSENEALAKYFITQYVKRREGYNYFSLQHDYDYVLLYSAENVATDYNALINSNQSPKVIYNKAEKTASVQDNPSVIISPSSRRDDKDMGAYIRFKLTIRNVATGQDDYEYWNVRLTYRIEPQVEMASGDRNNNPLKFVVTSYVRDKEVKG
ncbi:type IV secretion system protein [Escherichia coli]|jgi:type IV secretion system protein VirB8|uniref:virB8 family protein n=1 Tax=Enterobacterales TaxID=91347 RepID=UPI001141ED11|nr:MULTISPECIES: type IV secretion system protein [Enterobacteriaceae]EDC7434619.1 pilus assembly protein [Salmonella enterica subsp. enterica serovar Enteritidis]EDZ9376485.1 pilus assembly protein [Salmonella enterica]EES2272624.1 type IV secretion system protein [Escherichia coli]EFN6682847.1 type IV secretion system protein [Escherichia coli O179:H8]MBH2837234.1 type IV secretion system protein [Serratia marcescens]MDU0857477.1 type IV secretion system protein [Enterobacter asburiae]HDU4